MLVDPDDTLIAETRAVLRRFEVEQAANAAIPAKEKAYGQKVTLAYAGVIVERAKASIALTLAVDEAVARMEAMR